MAFRPDALSSPSVPRIHSDTAKAPGCRHDQDSSNQKPLSTWCLDRSILPGAMTLTVTLDLSVAQGIRLNQIFMLDMRNSWCSTTCVAWAAGRTDPGNAGCGRLFRLR